GLTCGSRQISMAQSENLLMVADSEHDANMLYATGMFVPDPFIFLQLRGRKYLVMSDLEIDRARKEAPHCHVLSLGDRQKKLRHNGSRKAGFAEIIGSILHEKRVNTVFVPGNFPLGLALELRRVGVKVKVK